MTAAPKLRISPTSRRQRRPPRTQPPRVRQHLLAV